MSTWGQRGVPRHKRRRILNRDNHECQLRLPGCTIEATEIDDIIPVAVSGVSRANAPDDNLQAVCHQCHAVKTEHERRTAHAAYYARRKQRRQHLRPHPGD